MFSRELSILLILLFLLPGKILAQVTLEGETTNEAGEPLAGAHIQIQDTEKGTYTDENGAFQLSGLSEGTVSIRASYVGYKTTSKEVSLESGLNTVNFRLPATTYLTEGITIEATRADEKTPIAYTNVSGEDIEKVNFGQAMPHLLQQTPSMVVTSDAGNGIGYTDMRIRGTASTRINVTINGIPLNDAESQGVYWVDLPDLATSTDNIQIQRGVGTSTNGAGAFGATVNIQTNDLKTDPYANMSHSAGSFNTRKHNAKFGTGLINDHWVFQGRLSRIKSDGYIDRAFSDLSSYYFSGAYVDNNRSLQLITFSGKEKTYQAWYGVPEDKLASNRTFNPYTYPDETDNYTQTHYQLHYNQDLGENFTFNTALHYTRGEGYYEQYIGEEYNKTISTDKAVLNNYGLENDVVSRDTIVSADTILANSPEHIQVEDQKLGQDTIVRTKSITQTDLIQRRWLKNDFYGATYSLKYTEEGPWEFTLGGAINQYLGAHYGEVIWAEYASNSNINHRYYDNDATKNDFNIYGKFNYTLLSGFNFFGDLQYRRVGYSFVGVDNDGTDLQQNVQHNFFNPKAGFVYNFNRNNKVYASFAVGNKEPNRNDYVDAPPQTQPESETLYDYEAGIEHRQENYHLRANFYYMDYKNQLVQTGEINDVGASIRTNIENSYRRGIEMSGKFGVLSGLSWQGNATFSQNKIQGFTSYVDNWDEGGQIEIEHGETNLSFSPEITGSSEFTYTLVNIPSKGSEPGHQFNIALESKYVGRQYIDNTSNEERSLDPYLVNNLRLQYGIKNFLFEEINISVYGRNIFNHMYETKAWAYRYQVGGTLNDTIGYFPQAGRNYLLNVNFKF